MKIKLTYERTGNILQNAGGKFTSPYRYSIPTGWNGLIHDFLEYCKKIEPTFVMPKVFIDNGCHVVFAREKFARTLQLAVWTKAEHISCAAFDNQFGVWDVQNRVVAF